MDILLLEGYACPLLLILICFKLLVWLLVWYFLSLITVLCLFNNAFQKRNGYSQGKRRMNCRTSNAQQDEVIRRTVYVSDIDQQVKSWNFLQSYCFYALVCFYCALMFTIVSLFFLYVRLLKSSLQRSFSLVDRYSVFYFALIFPL